VSADIGLFSKMPNKFFGSGTAARLRPSASILFLALCEHVNQKGEISFSVSDRTLAADTGLSARTICEARKRLLEQKLLLCSRDKGNSFTYTLRKYELPWIPVKDRLRPMRKPRGLQRIPRSPSANFAKGEHLSSGIVC
jgi:hypothetical protein